jgi:hypothetical protein
MLDACVNVAFACVAPAVSMIATLLYIAVWPFSPSLLLLTPRPSRSPIALRLALLLCRCGPSCPRSPFAVAVCVWSVCVAVCSPLRFPSWRFVPLLRCGSSCGCRSSLGSRPPALFRRGSSRCCPSSLGCRFSAFCGCRCLPLPHLFGFSLSVLPSFLRDFSHSSRRPAAPRLFSFPCPPFPSLPAWPIPMLYATAIFTSQFVRNLCACLSGSLGPIQGLQPMRCMTKLVCTCYAVSKCLAMITLLLPITMIRVLHAQLQPRIMRACLFSLTSQSQILMPPLIITVHNRCCSQIVESLISHIYSSILMGAIAPK